MVVDKWNGNASLLDLYDMPHPNVSMVRGGIVNHRAGNRKPVAMSVEVLPDNYY